MLRIAICDDMSDTLSQLKQLVLHWKPDSEHLIVETFQDADTLLSAHSCNSFDIILLDVVMPLLNGIDAARELRQFDSNVKIVFLTTSSEYAVESYTVKANNYLLKPISEETLHHCLDELYVDIQAQEKYILIKGINAIHRIAVWKIEYVEAQNKLVKFVLSDGTTIRAAQPLYSLEDQLLLSDGFFKCHRSYLVNIYRVETYTLKEITMRSGLTIPISRSYHKEFESAYFATMFGKAGDL